MEQISNSEIERIKQEALQEQETQMFALEFAKMAKQLGLTTDGRVSNKTMKKVGVYTADSIADLMSAPQDNEVALREVSRYLENTSLMYKRIVNYLPSIGIDCPVIVPANMDKFDTKRENIAKNYSKAVVYLDMLNIAHEFVKVKRTVFREDVFYGIEYEDEKNGAYYIRQLNPDYCRISSVEDSCYNFQFDFSFFDNDDDVGTLLNTYETIVPSFFRSGYTKYKNDRKNYQWQEVPSDKSICIKLQEDLDYCYPYFIGAAKDILNIQDYKDLEMVSTEQSNYRLLGFEIPRMSSKSEKPDTFEIKPSTALQFFNMARNSIDENIGMFISPMPVKDISFKDVNNNKNKVSDAVRDFYDSVGVTNMLFNGGDNSTATKYSIKTDEALLFQLNRSLERWLTRKFKRKFNGMFKVKLLDVTAYNKEDVITQLTNAATLGLPTKMQLASVVGSSTPLDVAGLTFLENDILGLHEKWIPLNSSYTQSGTATMGDDEGGRPESKDEDLSETGQSTRENDSNIRE